ncbi:MAG TPA: flagellar assembly protein FliH [Steroidobacteraceae bacterium]|nr:flagellar assembly protein FliH [Steroidobacteraceae bacterium]
MSDPQSAAASVERWSLPRVDGPVVGRERETRKSTGADGPRALHESEARGYQAGLARAQAETQTSLDALGARIKQLDSILQLLAKPLQELDAAIEKELLQLTLSVGKQLARRELRIDPAQVIAILRESLTQLPASARDIRVHLHPEDAATVRERLAAPANERAWTLVEDPTLTRGGCLLRTETSQIDVRLESRISAVIASALGEERAPERPAPQPGETEA